MKRRATFLAIPLVLVAAIGTLFASSCSSDDDTCDGKILTAPQDCSDCSCSNGQTTCTAFPPGDESSNQRCCSCK